MAERNQGIGYFERQLSDAGLEPSQFEQDVTQQPGRVYDTLFTPRSRAETVPHPLYGEVEEPYEFDPAGGIMGMAGRGLAMFDRKLEGLPVSDEQLAAATLDLVGPSASAVYLKGASNAAPGVVSIMGAAEGLYTPAPIRAKAVEARSLKSQGATDKEVFEQTGIFPGLDKQLRFEIDDSQARLRFPIKFGDKKYEVVDEFDDASQEVIGKVYTGKIQGLLGPLKDSPLGMSEPEVLGDFLHHPELYKVYPFMKETPISALPDNIKKLAGFNPKGPRGRPEIEMNPEAGMYVTADDFAKKRMQETGQASKEDIEQDVVSVLLHEIQHYAQYVDDLNRGGNSKMFLPDSIDGAEQSAQFAIDFAKNMAEKNGFKFDSKLKRFGKSLLSLEREIDLLMRRQDPGVLPEDYALQEAKKLKKLLKLQEEAKQGLGDRYDTVKAMESLLERTESARDRSYELYKNLGGEIESRAVQERFRGNRSLKESPIDTLNLVKGKSEPLIIQRNLTTPDEVKIKQEVQELNDYLNTTLNNSLNSDPELIKAAGRAKKEHGDLSKLPSDMTTEPQGFEFGGVAKPDPDRIEYAAELIRNTSPETFFSDIREAFKMQRVEGREYGDLLPFISRERVDRGPEGIDTTYYFDPRACGIADTVMDKFLQLGEKATDYFYSDSDSKVENYADGGVVSLKDRAVNMTRGPRSNGIMQYVPYMTGATNGY